MDRNSHKYARQQEIINQIAHDLEVVAYRPDYHGKRGDANTVLFYTKAAAAHNDLVDKQPIRYTASEAADRSAHQSIDPKYVYRDHFFAFENTDVNGFMSYDYANYGKLDFTRREPVKVIRAAVEYYLYLELQNQRYLEIYPSREADDVYNELNLKRIDALARMNGEAYFCNINIYDKKLLKDIGSDKKPFFTKYEPGMKIYNFDYAACVPCKDAKLEEMLRKRNSIKPYEGYGNDPCELEIEVDDILHRIHMVGGFYIQWF